MRKALILFLCVLLAGAGGILLILGNNAAPEPDAVAINDAVITAMQSGDPKGNDPADPNPRGRNEKHGRGQAEQGRQVAAISVAIYRVSGSGGDRAVSVL